MICNYSYHATDALTDVVLVSDSIVEGCKNLITVFCISDSTQIEPFEFLITLSNGTVATNYALNREKSKILFKFLIKELNNYRESQLVSERLEYLYRRINYWNIVIVNPYPYPMNIYEILVISKNKELGKGYYTSYEIISADLEQAKKLAISEASQDGYVAEVDEFELLRENQPTRQEQILNKLGKAYFDC